MIGHEKQREPGWQCNCHPNIELEITDQRAESHEDSDP